MKKILCILLICCSPYFAAHIISSPKHSKVKAKINGNKQQLSSDKKKLAKEIYERLDSCAHKMGCGLKTPYCNQPNCKGIIFNCHKIDSGEFDILTNFGNDGHAIFTKDQINDVLNGIVCNDDWIRCHVRDWWLLPPYYIIDIQDTFASEPKKYESFYSVPLLDSIYTAHNNTLVSVALYKGIKVYQGLNIYLIPVKAIYATPEGEIAEYFDVSNDLP